MEVKNICCIGAGYVGGPTMAVIATKCPQIKVTVVDANPEKINAWNGPIENLPVYEPGLSDVVKEVRGRNLIFSTDLKGAIEKAEMIFVAVNTPTKTEGEGAGMAADLRYVEACARDIAKYSKSDKIVIEKSTLPVRTAEKIKEILIANSDNVHFEILSNPEFLAEGTAIKDLFKSDRVLIGADKTDSGQKALKCLVDIYANWIPKDKILTTNVWSSELAKLASNAMLAQRISSINSFSALCEKTDANINELSRAIGSDHRIGPHFLKASVGFGGSCFQKDILNLVYLFKYFGLYEASEYWHGVVKINDFQKNRFLKKIIHATKTKKDKISILGWAFKGNTNDSRESPSIYIVGGLLKKKYSVNVYDPMIDKQRIISDLREYFHRSRFNESVSRSMLKNLNVEETLKMAVENTDVIAILTDWNVFKDLDFKKIIKQSKVIDGRFILNN